MHFLALVLIEMYDGAGPLNTPRLGEEWARVCAHFHTLWNEKDQIERQAHQRGDRLSSSKARTRLYLSWSSAGLFSLLLVLFAALLWLFPLRKPALSLLHALWRMLLLSE